MLVVLWVCPWSCALFSAMKTRKFIEGWGGLGVLVYRNENEQKGSFFLRSNRALAKLRGALRTQGFVFSYC